MFRRFLSLAGVLAAGAAAAGEMVCTVGREGAAPVLDGAMDAVYARSMPIGGFSFRNTMQFAWAWTQVRFVHDGRNLYGFASCCQGDARELVERKEDKGNELDFAFLTADGLRVYRFGPSGSFRLEVSRQNEANAWVPVPAPSGGARSAVAAGADRTWCLEFAIPLAELGGRAWRFNVRRLRPGQMESFWQRQEVGDFWHEGADFGLLALADEPLGAQAFAEFPRFPSEGRFEKAVTNEAGKVVYRYLYEYPRAPFVKISPNNLDGGVLHLDCGIGFESGLRWRSKHNYPGGEGKDGRAVEMPFKIRFRVPKGITVVGARKIEPKDGSPRQEVEVFEQVSPRTYGVDNYLKTFFTCTLPRGSKGTIAYATKYKDGGEGLRTFRFNVTEIRETTPPKRFVTGFYTLYPQSAAEGRKWSRIGLNTFAVRGFGDGALRTAQGLLAAGFKVRRGDYFWPGAEPGQTENFDAWGKEDESARALDIDGKPIRNGRGYQLSPSYRGRLFAEACEKEAAFLRSSGISWCAFDLEGYVQRQGEKGDFRPETLSAFRRRWAERHPDAPVPEPTAFERDPKGHPEEHRVWVETKCALWGGFFAEMKRRLEAGAGRPLTFSEWSMNAIADVEGRNHSLRDATFFRNFRYIELDTYAGIDRDLRQIAHLKSVFRREFPDTPLDVILTPSPHRLGLGGAPGNHYWTTAPAVKDEIVCVFKEAMTMGAKGVYVFEMNGADVECFRQVAEGVRLVNRAEDIVMDGTPVEFTSDFPSDAAVEDYFFGKREVWRNQPRVFTRGISLGDRMLLSVSEYRELKPITVKVNYASKRRVRAVDLEDGRTLGTFGPGDRTIPVPLDADRRCRLVLIEPDI